MPYSLESQHGCSANTLPAFTISLCFPENCFVTHLPLNILASVSSLPCFRKHSMLKQKVILQNYSYKSKNTSAELQHEVFLPGKARWVEKQTQSSHTNLPIGGKKSGQFNKEKAMRLVYIAVDMLWRIIQSVLSFLLG